MVVSDLIKLLETVPGHLKIRIQNVDSYWGLESDEDITGITVELLESTAVLTSDA